MYSGYITDVKGIAVGHEETIEKGTGVTVILPPKGNTAGVDVRGGAPGTRECVLLNPTYAVDEVHGFVLSGGSAYGLEAASGVMRGLREDNIGFDVGVGVVPIVPSAVLFDLTYKSADAWPDHAMGLSAYKKASTEEKRQGIVGAGTGATVAKSMGVEHAVKSGIGSASIKVEGVTFSAIVAVNAFGNIYDVEEEKWLAEPVVDGKAVSIEEALAKGRVDFEKVPSSPPTEPFQRLNFASWHPLVTTVWPDPSCPCTHPWTAIRFLQSPPMQKNVTYNWRKSICRKYSRGRWPTLY
ncbi:hypothetical protein PEPCOX59622_00175 [Aedoeadaptatus coxii]|nr:hypothetical protein PEPCOX59622_00175 [Peptoniphilus coxii]